MIPSLEKLPRVDQAAFALVLLQCALAPIPHVTAIANLTTFLLLVLVPAIAYRHRATLPIREPIVSVLGLLALYFVITSAVGPYPLESLNAWRKDLLPAIVLFAALLLTVTSQRRIRAVLLAVAVGAAIRLLLIGIEIWILHRPIYGDRPGFVNAYTGVLIPSAFYGGFALVAAIYSPLAAACLLRKDLQVPAKLLLWFTTLGAALIVIDYGGRTPLITLCAGLSVLFVIHLNWRMAVAALASALLIGGYVYWQDPVAATRYQSIFSLQTYSNGMPGQGITIGDRLRVWKGIVEIGNQRPIFGYGYGWKKLSYVVRDEGFLDRWKNSPSADPFSSMYFSRGYGGINPHNLAVHLYFEGGWLGIALFLALLTLLFRKTWQLFRRPEWEFRSLAILAGCFLFAWLAANIGNSLWAGEKLPFVVMALLAAASSRLSPTLNGDDPAKILVVRRDNIGDLVCTTPLLTGLRRRFPDAEICVLANSYNADVLRGNPDVDASFAYRKLKHRLPGESRLAAIWQRIALIGLLRRKSFDVAILAKSGFDKHGLRFARQVGARQIVGFAPPDGNSAAGLTHPLPARSGELRHEVEALADLAAHFGADVTPYPLTVLADPASRQRQRVLVDRLLPTATRLVALHISAREASRKWPADKVVPLIELLSRDPAWTVALMWAPGASDDPRHPGDDAFAWDICSRTQAFRVVPVPTRSLDELITSLSICQAFIGADGGAMHLAAGLGLPIVGLFENSEFKLRHWHPWRVPYELVHADAENNVAGIETTAVFAAWQRLLLKALRDSESGQCA